MCPHMKLISMFSISLFLVRYFFFTSFVKFFKIFFLLHPNACGISFNAVDQLHARTTVCRSTTFFSLSIALVVYLLCSPVDSHVSNWSRPDFASGRVH